MISEDSGASSRAHRSTRAIDEERATQAAHERATIASLSSFWPETALPTRSALSERP